MGFRYGQSWRTGPGRRAWISGPLWLWCVFWLLAIGPLLIWWTIKLLILIIVAIARALEKPHNAPAVPPPLRNRPRR